MPLSHSPLLTSLSSLFATIFVAFGINAIIRPEHALSFFELYTSSSTPSETFVIINALMVVYGIRDIFMGIAMYAAAYYKQRKVLGAIAIAGAGVAWVDGAVCKWVVGKGEWGHWGYAPAVAAVGGLLMGVLD